MPSTLSERIAALATRFANQILVTVRESVDARIEAGEGRRFRRVKNGRRRGGRRTVEAISALADRVFSEVRRHPEGIRAEKLRANVGLERSEIGRPVMLLLSVGRMRKTGETRRTTYYPTAPRAKAGGGSRR